MIGRYFVLLNCHFTCQSVCLMTLVASGILWLLIFAFKNESRYKFNLYSSSLNLVTIKVSTASIAACASLPSLTTRTSLP